MSKKAAPPRHTGALIFKGAFISNPVLTGFLGACPIVAGATGLFSSLILSFTFALDFILTSLIACLLLKEVSSRIRVGFYLLFGLVFTCPIIYFLEELSSLEIPVVLSAFLPLMAVNSLTTVRCEKFAVSHTVRETLVDSIAISVGYSIVFILTGGIREYLGNGTLGGVEVPYAIRLPGILMPFGGLIVLGYLAMLLRRFVQEITPDLLEESLVKIDSRSFAARQKTEEQAGNAGTAPRGPIEADYLSPLPAFDWDVDFEDAFEPAKPKEAAFTAPGEVFFDFDDLPDDSAPHSVDILPEEAPAKAPAEAPSAPAPVQSKPAEAPPAAPVQTGESVLNELDALIASLEEEIHSDTEEK